MQHGAYTLPSLSLSSIPWHSGVLRGGCWRTTGSGRWWSWSRRALWRFLFLKGSFSVHLRVVQDRANYTVPPRGSLAPTCLGCDADPCASIS